ncbi:MAG: hypothetical protein V4443_11030 [Pseudomonadota bacterium]
MTGPGYPWFTRMLSVLLLALLQACAVNGEGYDTVGVSYGVGFYEPYGYEYGGWGPNYMVVPPRHNGVWRNDPNRFIGGRRAGAPAPSYRPADPSRRMPSIPSRSRRR